MTADQERQSASLMRLAQAGDQTAYASLLVLLTSLTRQFARARLGPVVWVDDVVQETLLAVHGARQTYDSRRPFAPWFYAIASSRLIDVLRRERRVTKREVVFDGLPEMAMSSGAAARDDIDADAIHAAVSALPARQRAVIHGLKYQDQSVREVAGRLGMSESAVKVTAHRGYRALKRLLGSPTRED
ncbi:MAG TPA: sigma-70 family RNA polymerase sigma factor [Vicinamibacterales bacterium]|nr:sigma-70 family RNA polymerase sigma factor [Vicinamibacterales bacterium]